jgi:hypothetical protein
VLVRVALESPALLDVAGDGSAPFRAMHRDLVAELRSRGVLTFGNDGDEKAFFLIVASLPQAIRKLWDAALPTMVQAFADPRAGLTLAEVQDSTSLNTNWGGRVAIGVVSRAKAMQFGMHPDAVSFPDPVSNIEITRMDLVRESPRFREAHESSVADIPRGADRETIWAERFAPMAEAARSVAILDRYVVVDLLSNKRPYQGQGLVWFLEKLDAGPPVAVHLLAEASSRSQTGQACTALTRLRSALTTGGVRSLTVTLAETAAFRHAAHARHVRFGEFAILLDRGLATFEPASCSQSTPCKLCDPHAPREREQEVEMRAWENVRRRVLW